MRLPKLTSGDRRVIPMPAQKPGKSRQDYGTDLRFIRAVEAKFGPLWCDLAATEQNAKAPMFVSPELDSLTYPWEDLQEGGDGLNFWLNPPFSNIRPWAMKCAAAMSNMMFNGHIFFLTPASTGSNWFQQHVWNHAHIIFPGMPRLIFEGTDTGYPKDCCLSVYTRDPLLLGIIRHVDIWEDWCEEEDENDSAKNAATAEA